MPPPNPKIPTYQQLNERDRAKASKAVADAPPEICAECGYQLPPGQTAYFNQGRVLCAQCSLKTPATILKPEDKPAPPPTAKVCENCEGKIGKLETPHEWRGSIVCLTCFSKLSTAGVNKLAPTQSAAPPENYESREKAVTFGILKALFILLLLGFILWMLAIALNKRMPSSSSGNDESRRVYEDQTAMTAETDHQIEFERQLAEQKRKDAESIQAIRDQTNLVGK